MGEPAKPSRGFFNVMGEPVRPLAACFYLGCGLATGGGLSSHGEATRQLVFWVGMALWVVALWWLIIRNWRARPDAEPGAAADGGGM